MAEDGAVATDGTVDGVVAMAGVTAGEADGVVAGEEDGESGSRVIQCCRPLQPIGSLGPSAWDPI